MTPPDETLSWHDDELEFEIARSTPESSEFVCEWRDGGWSARVERIDQGETRVLHAVVHMDRRMALYDMYGHLWLQSQPVPAKGSVWDPTTPRPSVSAVSRYVHEKWVEPEDLNPEEIAAVYGIGPFTKRN